MVNHFHFSFSDPSKMAESQLKPHQRMFLQAFMCRHICNAAEVKELFAHCCSKYNGNVLCHTSCSIFPPTGHFGSRIYRNRKQEQNRIMRKFWPTFKVIFFLSVICNSVYGCHQRPSKTRGLREHNQQTHFRFEYVDQEGH